MKIFVWIVAVFNVIVALLVLENHLGKLSGSTSWRFGPRHVVAEIAKWLGFLSPAHLLAAFSGTTVIGDIALLALRHTGTLAFLSKFAIGFLWMSIPLAVFTTWSYIREFKNGE